MHLPDLQQLDEQDARDEEEDVKHGKAHVRVDDLVALVAQTMQRDACRLQSSGCVSQGMGVQRLAERLTP